MARREENVPPFVREIIALRLSLEETYRRAVAGGYTQSKRTLARRMAESAAAAGVDRPRPAPLGPDLPATPDDIPAGTDVETLNRWLERAERGAAEAERDGNLSQIGNMGRLAKALIEARHKATPPAPPNPDDNPDMVALAAVAAEKFHKLIDLAAGGPPAS